MPIIKEVQQTYIHLLRNIATPPNKCLLSRLDWKVLNLLAVSTISRVYTVEEVKVEMLSRAGDGSSFTGILFSYLTTFDIDQSSNSVVSYKW